MFTIEKNVPLISKQVYPFDKMESGDSFFIPNINTHQINHIRGTAQALKKKMPSKSIVTRREHGGLRVWLFYKG